MARRSVGLWMADVYDLTTRRRFKCAACHRQFSVTSGTILASRKLSFVDLLGTNCQFVNAAKGLSAAGFHYLPASNEADGEVG
ncbi:hypothetical protein SAMN04244581_01949 [Paracoccus denitrificans]|jgi:transposase-like protein|nr:transposase-like protein [Paracoccus denitrificans]SDI60786.1 hypothetical protein SAMN04244581_01949 [Paracoccus denitrificans]SFR05893.1 hypothetical protein SAMN04244569_01931 [Paracoccus denitrificans]